jgi:endopolyphosphatase
VNATFDWIEKNLKDEVDFVVWTGDSARHDNDEHYPRNNKQIQDLNRYVVGQFVRVFGKNGEIDSRNPLDSFVVPIVPTWGNNDILPHNIFTPGPNRWTREFEDIWRGFVPQEQKHSFARGGWFFSEVIPNKLAVFSLNTLYFFDSNSAVDGCDIPSEPGYEHMEWLRIQLQFLRDRGMKAILIGHVPPARTDSKQNWDESCYQKYTLWLRQYRDVIIANIFGHMNIDHFMFQDVKELKYKFEIDGVDNEFKRKDIQDRRHGEPIFTAAGKASYLTDLHDIWSQLPKPPKGNTYTSLASPDLDDSADDDDHYDINLKKKKKKHHDKKRELDKFLKKIGGLYGERFSLSVVSPSIVPNFFPTLRIIEYNITGLEHDHPASQIMGIPAEMPAVTDIELDLEDADDDEIDIAAHNDLRRRTIESDTDVETTKKKHKKKKHHKKKPRKPTFPVPDPPSSTSPPGPAYSPQSLTFLSWTQLYANLTTINAAFEANRSAKARLELHPEDHWGGAQGKKGHVERYAAAAADFVTFETEYTTNKDKYYKMTDLTVRSWLELAERIGREELAHPSSESSEAGDLDPSSSSDTFADADQSEVVDDGSMEESSKKKKGKKKKGKKGKKKKMKNHLWKEFLHRAFVHTKLDEELDDTFGGA